MRKSVFSSGALSLLGLFLIFFVLGLFCYGIYDFKCYEKRSGNAYIGRSETVPFITLHGGYGADKSYLEYDNQEPGWSYHSYLIKHINRGNGDSTIEIFLLEPDTKREVKVYFNDGFIIMSEQTGAEVGFISANP